MARFDPPARVLSAARTGLPAIIVDGHGPTAEADIYVPAALATTANVAFLVRYGCGYLRAAVTASASSRLRIPPMRSAEVGYPTAPLPYLVSVDAAEGTTTGISAADRAHTLRVLADPLSTPSALIRPGHVVVAQAFQPGRAGKCSTTAAAIELANAAGLPRVGALCTLVSQRDETRMAVGSELLEFAREHRLPVTSASCISRYCGRTEIRARWQPPRSGKAACTTSADRIELVGSPW